jgi:putative transposase
MPKHSEQRRAGGGVSTRDSVSLHFMAHSELLFEGKYRIPSARLQHYDYASAGMYFVTINAFQHHCLFGRIEHEVIVLSEVGKIIDSCWSQIPDHFPHVILDSFQVMPNHIHGILFFVRDGEGAGTTIHKPGPMQVGSLSSVINSFKGAVTFAARNQTLAEKIWQPRFHDHVIRSYEELQRIREYIITNPAQWQADRYYRL